MGESLFASTEQPVYRLEPSPEERGFRREVEPLFRLRGDGGVFEKSLMISRKLWNSLVNWIFICNFAA